MRRTSRFSASALALVLASFAAHAHDVRLPVAADELRVRAVGAGGPSYEFSFSAQEPILLNHDPRVNPTAVLVYGTGADAGSTGRLDLDPLLWTAETIPGPAISGYVYSDPTGPISSATLRQGELQVSGSALNWPWSPAGPVDELWFWFVIEDEWLCAEADISTATLLANTAGRVWFQNTTAPFSCPEQVCGNGVLEVGELCDDGNLVEGDGCSNDCQSDTCQTANFNTTYEGIQSIIFDGYSCNNALCHNPAALPTAAGGLDLTAAASYDQLVNVISTIASADGVTFLDRVEPSEPVASFLYEKLSAATNATPTGGVPMPFLGAPLTAEHLEAVDTWIRAGAPENLVVAGTAGLLGTCLPPEDPLKIEPPAPLPLGEGVQFRSTAWDLPASSEDELCYATYYDLTATNLVPEEDQLDCPGFGSTNNPSGKCFYYNRRILRQDAQSHHSIIQIYNGDTSITEPGAFGAFTYKPNYPNEPGAPSGSCDPLQVDPATGQHADCSSATVSGVACTGFEPVDVATAAPSFAGSQEPYVDDSYAAGVYSVLPMTGVIIWNSHAFNLTSGDSTMAQYLDMYFGATNQRLFLAQGIFDASKIFIQNVPPFETREYCKTYTVEGGASSVEDVHVFQLGSHTHRWGTRFRIWAPPNEPCDPGGFNVFSCEENCNCGPGDPLQLLYYSTQYTDPVSLEFDPPMALGTSIQDRTFLYCSLYDNGSTPNSPPVKQQSTSPDPPPFNSGGFPLELGGPCPDVDTPYLGGQAGTFPGVTCMDGPNQGQPCGSEADPGHFCETAPFANDGVCDACTVIGGFTTEDEMFILTGSYFVPEPPFVVGIISGLALLSLLNRHRKQRPR